MYKGEDEVWCPVLNSCSEFTKEQDLNVSLNIRHLFNVSIAAGKEDAGLRA